MSFVAVFIAFVYVALYSMRTFWGFNQIQNSNNEKARKQPKKVLARQKQVYCLKTVLKKTMPLRYTGLAAEDFGGGLEITLEKASSSKSHTDIGFA